MDRFVAWVGIAIGSALLGLFFLVQVLRLMTESGADRFVPAVLLIASGAGLYGMWRVARRMSRK